jgi:hypothetical protein
MYRSTAFAFLLSVMACVASGCGSSSPSAPTPAPILPATLSSQPGGTLNALNNCDATRTLARVTGSATAQCAFTGVMVDTGTGCAANVRGTTTAARDNAGSQQTGTAPWSYGAIVRPGEQFSYQLSTLLAIPSAGEFFWQSTAAWDDVRCP